MKFLALLLLVSIQLHAKVRILTFHYNRGDFIELQHQTFQKFLQDDYELIVFNDAKTEENKKWIEEVCQKYEIECVRFHQEWHMTDPLNYYLQSRLQEPTTHGWWGWTASTAIEEFASHPSVRHCHVIQYALDNYGYDHDDIVVIMDGDNFLIQPLSIRELLGTKDLVAFNQRPDHGAALRREGILTMPKGKEMPWVVFIAFNPTLLPDVHDLHLNVDVVSGHPDLPHNTIVDTGAAIYPYLWSHPDLKLEAYPWQDSNTFRNMTYYELKALGLSDRCIQFIHDVSPGNVQFFVFEHFVHFSASSFDNPGHPPKIAHLHDFIEDILE